MRALWKKTKHARRVAGVLTVAAAAVLAVTYVRDRRSAREHVAVRAGARTPARGRRLP